MKTLTEEVNMELENNKARLQYQFSKSMNQYLIVRSMVNPTRMHKTRSWFAFMAEAFKTIFGTATTSDVRGIAQQLEKIRTSDTTAIHIANK